MNLIKLTFINTNVSIYIWAGYSDYCLVMLKHLYDLLACQGKKWEKNGYLSSLLMSLNIVMISGLPLLLGGKWIK